MDKTSVSEAAKLLEEAMRDQCPLDELPTNYRPLTLPDAYAVQDLFAPHFGGRNAGYKIGATNSVIRKRLSLEAPFFGRLMSARVYESPAEMEVMAVAGIMVETEYAFHMAADLPCDQGPYDIEQVAAAVGALVPAIEIVDTRFSDLATIGACQIVADNGLANYWVHGSPTIDWRDIDIRDTEISTSLNGEIAVKGTGGNVLGHPLEALRWLANDLSGLGRGLRAGDYVSTGSCTDIFRAAPGDYTTADFGSLGRVSVRFASTKKGCRATIASAYS